MPVNLEDLRDATLDLKQDVQRGHDYAERLASTAAFYGLAPALLDRKFRESFGDPEAVRRAFESAQPIPVDPVEAARQRQERIERVASLHRRKVSEAYEVKVRLDTYTVIAPLTFGGPGSVAIRHRDLSLVNLKGHIFQKK